MKKIKKRSQTPHSGIAEVRQGIVRARNGEGQLEHAVRQTEETNFYESREWLALRYRVLRSYEGKCGLCFSESPLHVDHIKPRSRYPELALEFSNLQILCASCNRGKSNIFIDDFRRRKKPKTRL